MVANNHTYTIEYFRKLLKFVDGNLLVNPWLVLEDVNLARNIAKRLALLIDKSSIDGICILADSGIPIGVLVAQSLELPLYVYRRRPHLIDDVLGVHHIFPIPPNNSNLILVDSHITTGFTSSSCRTYLLNKGCHVDSILTPVAFWDLLRPDSTRNLIPGINYLDLMDGDNSDYLLGLLFGKLESTQILKSLTKDRKSENNEEAENLPTPPKLSRFVSILLSIFRLWKKPNLPILDAGLANYARQNFGFQESEIWKLFAKPTVLKTVCLKTGNQININQYDYIVCTGLLGTLFALSLSWHNEFSGQVITSYNKSYDTQLGHLEGKRGLIISGRIRTGIFIRELLIELKKENVTPEMILVLRKALTGVAFPRRLMIYEEMNKIDIDITCIS